MKFGQQLRTSLIKDYLYYYIAYDDLKNELKSRLYPNGRPSSSAPKQWTEEDEKAFVRILEAELDKVFTFQKVKSGEIVRRIMVSQKEVEDVIRQLDRRPLAREGGSNGGDGQGPTEEDFELLEEDLSDIIADVHDLAKFTQLNYTGFQKIIKKHDKQTGWTLRPVFGTRLNAKPFFKDNYDAFIVKLSKLYDLVRTRGNPTKGDSSAGGSQQNFVRQTTKYWVHPDNITELKLIILKHLPVLVFNPNKEFEKQDSAISSIYYDNRDFDLYLGRLQKDEGAEAIRLRWYGPVENQQIFVERKTHREDWTGEKSVKARFVLKEKNVNAYMKGEFTIDQAFDKMRKEGKKSKQEIENLEALAREIQYSVITTRLEPVVRSFYNRTAFQLPGDARVRISLDTELSMIREDNWDGKTRSGENWRRTDIGIDYPFSQLDRNDIERFPYAILEVKLQTQAGQEPPEWVRELTSSHLVEAVPKFSKFIHGTATLFPYDIKLLPYWMPQMGVDIRKPATHVFGIERPNHTASISTSDEPSDSDLSDVEETPARPTNGASGTNSAHHSGGGNQMDEEERVAAPPPHSDSPTIYNSEDEESGSFDDFEHPRYRHSSALSRNLRSFARKTKRTLRELIPTPAPTILPGAAPAQTVYSRPFRAPPGKCIFVPVRIEPKVYFAAERTFLSWFEFSIIISAIATTLLNFAGETKGALLYASLGFTVTAVASLIYAAGLYLWRVKCMRERRAARYHEKWGPNLLCALMVIAVVVNFYGAFSGEV